MKLLIFLAFFSAILALVFFQVEGLTCYSCGYREDADGTRTEIPNTYEDVPFCGVDNLNDTSNVHTEEAPVVRTPCFGILRYKLLVSLEINMVIYPSYTKNECCNISCNRVVAVPRLRFRRLLMELCIT